MRVSVEVEVPNITVAAARQMVRAIDAQEDDVPIDLDKVTGLDVLELMLNGTWNPDYLLMTHSMTDDEGGSDERPEG